MTRFWAVVLAALLAWPMAGHAADEPAPLDLADAKAIIGRMDADPRLAAIFALCPADAFKRDAPFLATWRKPDSTDPGVCSRSPSTCHTQCMADGDSGACFGLARAFQLNPSDVPQRYPDMLFAMACDAGMGSGCTNRASSLRNAPVPGDPLLALSAAVLADCEYRSFNVGCRQGDAWSCAMEGQAFQLGEGIAADPAQARTRFKQTCDISPTFVACDFAKRHLAAMQPGR